MSIDIDWDTLTAGPAGLDLADTIRHFIHDKFQQIALPRFIRSVEVHSFAFGAHAPTITLKDVTDPLPAFYDDDDGEDDDDDDNSDGGGDAAAPSVTPSSPSPSSPVASAPPTVAIAVAGAAPSSSLRTRRASRNRRIGTAAALFANGHPPSPSHAQLPPSAPAPRRPLPPLTPLSLGGSFVGAGTPGIPGGTSNLSYFHLPLGAGLGGTGVVTPLAAVSAAWAERRPGGDVGEREAELPSRPSTARSGTSWSERREGVMEMATTATAAAESEAGRRRKEADENDGTQRPSREQGTPRSEPAPTDVQVVLRVEYAGDVRLALTTEILLDYPMPSFVGIPLTLSVTGVRFDGVALLAYRGGQSRRRRRRRRAHFCFLAPEDAEVLIGAEDGRADGEEGRSEKEGRDDGGSPPEDDAGLGGLLKEIRIESEIGQKEGGKQVLKNVGKVEKFVLEQVRRIFEDEFVWPSYYTFLV